MNETPATVRMIDGATAPAISNVFVNNACAVCTLQITGSFTAATVLVEGIVNVASNQWVTLAAFNLSDLSLEKDGADKAGIYQVGIEGILRVRMNVTEVSGGDITIAAQFGNATINQFSETEASNLIPITAYDLAVAGGYTGSREDYERALANVLNVEPLALQAAESAENAEESATNAASSATTAANATENMAPVYSSSSTYSVDDYVLHDNLLYKCVSAITTPQTWTAANWKLVKMGPEISDLSVFVTPEMFGSISGDASDAISACVEYAIANNKIIVIDKNLSFSQSIELNARNIQLYSFGVLTYTGYDYAIKCQYPRQKLYIYSLVANNGGGVQIDTSLYNVQYINIEMLFADCLKECFYCVTSNSHYVTYTKSIGNLWKSTNDYPTIRIEVGEDGSFIGECTFDKVNLLGKNGFYINGSSVSAVRANAVSVEGITADGFIINNSKSIDIKDCRYAELQGRGQNVIKIIGEIGLRFVGNYGLKINSVDISEMQTPKNPIVFDVPILSPTNVVIAQGLAFEKSKKILRNPTMVSYVYASGNTVNIHGYIDSGFVQTVRFTGSDDTEVILSEYHVPETYPYIAFNLPSAKTYTIKDYTGTTIATLSGYGQYIVTLDYNHFVIKKS